MGQRWAPRHQLRQRPVDHTASEWTDESPRMRWLAVAGSDGGRGRVETLHQLLRGLAPLPQRPAQQHRHRVQVQRLVVQFVVRVLPEMGLLDCSLLPHVGAVSGMLVECRRYGCGQERDVQAVPSTPVLVHGTPPM